MLLLYTSFVFPFCLCASFPSNTTKHGFSLRFQLGFGMMSSCPTLCGHSKNILSSASSRMIWGCWIPFSRHHKETSVSPFSFVQILACLGEVRCLHLIVIGIDWHLLKSPGGKKAKLTRRDYPLRSSSWIWRLPSLCEQRWRGRPAFFSWWLCVFGQSVFCLQRGPEESLLANNEGLKGTNEAGWCVSSGSQFLSLGKNDHCLQLPSKSSAPPCRSKFTKPPRRKALVPGSCRISRKRLESSWSKQPLARVLCVCPCVCACANGPFSVWLAVYFVWKALGCLGLYCSFPSIQRHANELVNSTEQLINLLTSVLGPAGRHERNPSGISLWPCVAPGAFLSLLLLSVELEGWASWFLEGLSLF